jgi:hypothetical protein
METVTLGDGNRTVKVIDAPGKHGKKFGTQFTEKHEFSEILVNKCNFVKRLLVCFDNKFYSI